MTEKSEEKEDTRTQPSLVVEIVGTNGCSEECVCGSCPCTEPLKQKPPLQLRLDAARPETLSFDAREQLQLHLHLLYSTFRRVLNATFRACVSVGLGVQWPSR